MGRGSDNSTRLDISPAELRAAAQRAQALPSPAPQNSGQPLLFLDVDGVINCLNLLKGGHGEEIMTDKVTVCLPHGIRARLKRLDEVFEIIWTTAWFRFANGLLRDMNCDIGPFEVLNWGDFKLDAILKRAQTMPWAFVDDEVDFELKQPHQQGFLLQRQQMFLQTRSTVGLTDAEVDQLLAFAAKFS